MWLEAAFVPKLCCFLASANTLKDFDAIAKVNNFNTLEKPSKFIISPVEFTIQNELVTPTLKPVRKKIEK